jgi:hypothetical protein
MSTRQLAKISLDSVWYLGNHLNGTLPFRIRPCTLCLSKRFAVGAADGSGVRSQSAPEAPKKAQIPTESPGMVHSSNSVYLSLLKSHDCKSDSILYS